MTFSTIWSLSCLLKQSFKNTLLPEALGGLVDKCDPVLGGSTAEVCVVPFQSEVLAHMLEFATVVGFRIR